MKKLIIAILFISSFISESSAQSTYGKTLNLGVGVGGYSGYYHYVGHSMSVFHLNYEFDVAKNFTLAPFISFSTVSNEYYWGDKNNPYRYYTYRQTIIPIGVKGTYYFDDLLKANADWDFYLGGSLGFALVNSHWDNGYNGSRDVYQNGDPLFLNVHLGTEYHFNERIGAFLDLSTGVSTVGLAIHGKK